MKKTLAAAALILAGVALAVAVMPLFGVSFDWFIPSEPETQIYDIDAPFTALDVQAEGCDVFLYRDRGSEAEVYMPENSRIDAVAEVVDGVLTVRWSRRSSWVDRLRDDDYISLSVYLPSDSCKTITVTTDSGDVYASDRIGPDSLTVTTDSGTISVWDLQDGNLSLTTGSGDIFVSDSTAADAVLTAGEGDVWLSDVELDSLQVGTGTGDVSLTAVKTAGEMVLSSEGGDVMLWDSDGAGMDITTGSGDVTGDILSPKRYEIDAGGGSVHTPPGDENGGLCRITTGGGDVYLEQVQS